MVDNNIKITQTQGEILSLIEKDLNITEIAKYRKCSRQAVYKVLKILSKNALIEKIGYAHGLTQKGKEGLHSLMGFTYKKRLHNLHFKVEIKESPRNWDKKRSQLITLPYFNKRVQLKNNQYDIFNFGKVQIKTTSKSVIIKIPPIYDDTIENAIIQAMDIFYSTVSKIEHQFKIKLIKDRRANITIISQEWARLQDPIAKLYQKEDKKLYVTDENNEVWLIADFSFATNELETISVKQADEDMIVVNNFLNDLRKNPMKPSEIMTIINGMAQNQLMFDRNIQKHFEVLKGIEDAIKELREEVKMGKFINKKDLNKE